MIRGGVKNGSVSDDRATIASRVPAGRVKASLGRAVARAQCGCWAHLSRTRPVRAVVEPCHRLVTHSAFEAFIMFLIFANTVVLALDSHPTDSVLDTRLENINFVLTVAVRAPCGLVGRRRRLCSRETSLPYRPTASCCRSSGWRWC